MNLIALALGYGLLTPQVPQDRQQFYALIDSLDLPIKAAKLVQMETTYIPKGQGEPWPFDQLIAICIVNYIYKFIVAIILTPVIYLVHNRIEKYLGHDQAATMKKAAMGEG